MKPLGLRALGLLLFLGVLQSSGLQAQHFSLTTHTNYIPRVADFSNENLNGDNLQTLGLDLRVFRNQRWAFRFGVVMQGENVYNAFSDEYQINVGGSRDFDPDDWDDELGQNPFDEIDPDDWDEHEYTCYEFDYERFAEDYDVMAEFGLERHFFLLNRKLDIYPGVYLPIYLGPETNLQQALSREALMANAGATLGGSLRLLGIFRVGVELDAGFGPTRDALAESFQARNLTPMRTVPYQTSLTFGMAF
ncbi:MAG: hypothetical protein AAFQ87_05365 [Bacteroidota bacterium]